MDRNTQVARAVHYALMMSALSAGTLGTQAMAQGTAATGEELTTVVVTGSRLKQANLTTTSPVTQVTSQDVATQGVTRIEDLINQLPQAFAAQNATVSNGSTGTATVDLRGLGAARTLVLVDGRRLPYGGVTDSAADLNQIPTQMVDRVEILTGGASAVYGSDAISGVVNFIMKKNFEGVSIDAQYGFYQHNNSFSGPGTPDLRTVIASRAATNPAQFRLPDDHVTDGYGKEVSLLMGLNSADGRGNFTAYASWQQIDAILQANRDYSACSLDTVPPTVQFRCGGSSTSYPGRFTNFGSVNVTVDATGAGNTFRPFSSALDQYNFGPLNHYQRPEQRYALGGIGHFELNDRADVYTQLMFSDYRSIAQIAPGGDFGDTTQLNCDNPLMSAQQKTTIGCTAADITAGTQKDIYLLRRNVEGGGRQQDFHNNSFRGIVGVKGDLSKAWSYDASAQFSRVTADQKTLNYFVTERIQRALDVVAGPNGPICRSVQNGTDPNCVPYNVFQIGGVTPAALNYLQAPGLQTGIIDQELYNASFTGDLGSAGVKLPTANEAVSVALGAEYRRDKLVNTTDALLTTAALSGTGGPTISVQGATQVTDLFAEARIPIANDKTFAKKLGVELAYRFSDYGNSLTTDTYKVSADWAPVDAVRFRGSFQRAVRAANIVELFTAQGFNLFDMAGDPCGAAARNPNATAAKCIATGVPAANVGATALDSPAGQYQFNQGGNPNLQPEKSDTVSFGIVFTPGSISGLNASVDYFNIKIDGTISTFGSENTLNACYNNNDPAACSRIHRNPNGLLWLGSGYVDNLNVNIGSLKTKGVDLNFNYSGIEIGRAGKLGFNVTGTYLDELVTNPGPGIAPYDCKGLFAGVCGTPNPKWRHHARVAWTTPWKGLDLALTWRYYAKVDMKTTATNRIDQHFPSFSYVDLAANFPIMGKAQARFGVNNLLDKDPPLNATVGTTGNGNTYPQTYEALGRYIFGGVTVKF